MLPSVVCAALPAEVPHVPVAIVGAGACGLTAALMLSDAGVACVLLERDAAPSGSSALSSGFIPAAGTQVQRAADVADSAERFAADIQTKAHGTAASHLVAAYTQAIAPAIDALQARHGIAFVLLDGFLYPGHSAQRMHAVPEKTGVGLMARLQQAAASAQIPVIGDALVRELWIDDQADAPKVRGIGYQRPDGKFGAQRVTVSVSEDKQAWREVAQLTVPVSRRSRKKPKTMRRGKLGTDLTTPRQLGVKLLTVF
jgi:fumarate reductase flavoprotein subunit